VFHRPRVVQLVPWHGDPTPRQRRLCLPAEYAEADSSACRRAATECAER
jgi:hypothetical protein